MRIKEKLEKLVKEEKIELLSTHEHLSVPIIERIYQKMILNLKFGSIQVDNGVIIDGHHRYVASLLANYKLERVPGLRSQAKKVIEWNSVNLVVDDWDTPAKVKFLNEQDAKFNELSLEDLLETLKFFE